MASVPDIVPITDLRQDASGVVRRAADTQQPVFITQRGRATAVVVSARAYERTQHELEILRLLSTPKSPAQIASELFLSKKTVQNHISAIYRKLTVGSRSEAIVKGMELHLIDSKG